MSDPRRDTGRHRQRPRDTGTETETGRRTTQERGPRQTHHDREAETGRAAVLSGPQRVRGHMVHVMGRTWKRDTWRGTLRPPGPAPEDPASPGMCPRTEPLLRGPPRATTSARLAAVLRERRRRLREEQAACPIRLPLAGWVVVPPRSTGAGVDHQLLRRELSTKRCQPTLTEHLPGASGCSSAPSPDRGQVTPSLSASGCPCMEGASDGRTSLLSK